MSIEELLKKSVITLRENEIEEANLKAKMLLMHILRVSKQYLVINKDLNIDDNKKNEFEIGIKKLCEHIPIQYIINSQEFFGYIFFVDNNVLIPQPDTEVLVEEVINIISNNYNFNNKKIKLLDLCTGSGAIGISLSKEINNLDVYLSDISEKALEIAKKNAKFNKVNVKIIKSDLFKSIMEKNFDFIVSNPPYIESETIKELSEEVKKEPKVALDGGVDGLDFYKEISKKAKEFLKINGYLILEIGYNQKEKVTHILEKEGYKNIYCKKDLGKIDRVIVAQK